MPSHFKKQMMCTCSNSTFTSQPVVFTKPEGKWSFGTDVVLKCLVCLKEYIFVDGTTQLCSVTQTDGKALVRSSHTRQAPLPDVDSVSVGAMVGKAVRKKKPSQEIFPTGGK